MKKAFAAACFVLAAVQTPALAQLTPAAAPKEPIATSVFARLPQLESPRISTDGSALAAKVRSNGEHYLAIVPLDGKAPELIAKDGEFDRRGDLRATSWRWIDPDNLLIWVSSRQDLDGEKVDMVRVVGYNRKTKKTTPLGWDGAFVAAGEVLWQSRSGPPRILLARMAAGRGTERIMNREVIEVDVTTGRHKVVLAPQRGVQSWYADGEGNIRMGISSDRQTGRTTVLYRSGGSGPFRTIIRERTERYSEPPIPRIFLADDKALVLSRHEGFRALYEVDLNTMEFGRKIYGVDGYDLAAIGSNLQGNALESITVVEDGVRVLWQDARLKEIQEVMDETFGAGKARIASADHARENIVVHVGGPNQSGGYYLFKTVTGDLKHVGWVNTELRDMELNPVRTIRYQASDGKTIPAVLTLPRLKQHRSLPLIVLPHGGPWARDFESWDMWAQPLAEMGYAVIQPNFRGSSGFGRDWEAASDGNWGLRMQDDLNDAITHLAAQGIADPRRVCIFGWSYGGYAASRAAQRDGDKYRCAISGAGVHDLPDMVAYDKNYLGPYGAQYIGAAASRLADISPSRFAKDVSIPIMIVHGARDDRVPVAQSRNFVRRLEAAGKVAGRDFIYIEQPRNTHHLPLESDRLQLLEEMKKFLAEHNPA